MKIADKKLYFAEFAVTIVLFSCIIMLAADFHPYDAIQSFDITSYYVYPDVFNNLFTKKPLNPEDIKKYLENSTVNEKILENFQLTANLLLSGSYFEHYRSSKAKGFEITTNLTVPRFLYKPNPLNDYEYNDFMYQRTYRIFIDDTIRERIKRYTQTVGVIEQGEGSFIPMGTKTKLTDIINDTILSACKNCIENAIERLYGRNYLFMIKGDFLLASAPSVFIKNGNVIVRVKGFVIISDQKYMP